ncbi:MAG: large protein, partial [Myxococcaceae bacterium]|nr:large protein [Myxococcaceae bacterium]
MAVAATGPGTVALGSAAQYTILASTAVTNVPTSVIAGKLGLSPAAASYITGLSLTNAGDHWTSPQVSGGVVAADSAQPAAADLTVAVHDMQTAYTDAAARTGAATLNLGAGAVGGMTLRPGLYTWTSSVTMSDDVTLTGGPEDTWIFQITGDLTLSA